MLDDAEPTSGNVLSGIKESIEQEESASPPSPAREPEAQETEAQPSAPAAAPEAPTEAPFKYDYDFQGRKISLDKDQLNQLLELGISSWQEALKRTQAPAEEAPEKAAEGEPKIESVKDLVSYIKNAIKQEMNPYTASIDDWRRETQVNSLLQETEKALSKHDTLKALSDFKGGRGSDFLKSWVLAIRQARPDMSYDSVAREIADMLAYVKQGEVSNYVQSKVRQSAQKVEKGGGGTPAPGSKEFSPDDVFSGKVKNSVIQQLLSSEE